MNRDIGLIYQAILAFTNGGDSFGDLDAFPFEHFLAWLDRLMKVYQRKAEEE